MQTIEITKDNAAKAYNEADDKGKKLLISLLGTDIIPLKNIIDRIKTFEDACVVLGIRDDYELEVKGTKGLTDDIKSIVAYSKLIIIARALNEGWKADWNDTDQLKWIPWFEKSKSGFGLSYGGCDDWGSTTDVGSRLCYKTSELAEYAGKQFESIYNDFLNL